MAPRLPPPEPPAPERSAALVAGLTAAARAMGLVRTVVMTTVLGVTFLGNTYASANSIPNLVFEIVAGGALAAVLVPSLSGAVARGDRARVEVTSSAFSNTALLVLTPVVVAGLLLRGPLMALLTSGVQDPEIRRAEQELGEFLLLMFLPQIWLYGVGVVLTGVLHAHHKFAAPALAPLLSSVVVTGAYLLYFFVEGDSADRLGEVSLTGQLILGLGTTAGVAALSLSLVLPVRRLGIRWRRVVRIPSDAARTARRLLGSAVVAVAGQQVLLGVVLVIANRVEGGVVAYQLAFTVLLLPWAILAVPVAVAAFPGLAQAMSQGDEELFARRCSQATRSLALLLFGGSALLLAAAAPISRAVLGLGAGGEAPEALLVPTVAAFAPALIGYGAYAHLSRAAFARGDGRSPAVAAAVGFGLSAILDVAAVLFLESAALIAALGGSFSIGMTAGAGVLLLRLRSAAGKKVFQGVGVTSLRGLVAAAISAVVGLAAAAALPAGGVLRESMNSLIVAAAVGAAYVASQKLMGDREMRRAVLALRGSR